MVSRTERTPFAHWWWTVDRLMLAALITLMLGVIVAIEMAHSYWKIRRLERVRTRPVNQAPPDAALGAAGANENADPAANPD